MKTGIQISSLKPLLTTPQQVREAFEKVKAAGCQYVQLQWIDPSVSVEEIAGIVHETGLQSVSVQDFFEKVWEDPAYYIRLNQLTEGDWLCVSRIPDRFRSPEGLSQAVDIFRALAGKLEAYGQRLCFHPVYADYQNVGDIIPVDYLLEQMPDLQLCVDLYHLNRTGNNMPEWLAAHAGRVCMVHFKDETCGRLVPAGQGDTDWHGVAQACREAGAFYAFVEQESWDRDPFECLKEALFWINEQVQQMTDRHPD